MIKKLIALSFLGYTLFFAQCAFTEEIDAFADPSAVQSYPEENDDDSLGNADSSEEQQEVAQIDETEQHDEGDQAAEEKQENMHAIKNTLIAIIGPSGYISDIRLEKGIRNLEARGYQVINYYDPLKRYQRFAAEDHERIKQINDAVSNPDVRIIMPIRGGYGMSRLLPYLDFDKMAQSGKLFVGYSDFTAFQMALLKKGGVSFSGPMLSSDFGEKELSDFTLTQFDTCLHSTEITLNWFASGNPNVDLEGIFWGGNLAMLAHLTGTPWLPEIEGGILFVEDVGEQPYRIERMLLQLDEAGILRKQKALILGQFTKYKVTDYDNGYDFDAMLAWLRARLTIPVLTGLPFGHVKDKATLPIGASAHLVSRRGVVQLRLSQYPSLSDSSE